MSHCPSCGRYVGPHEACPYCGARLVGRLPIRIVKVVAVALATVGLALLWLVARRAEVPLIHIGQAGATTNLAYVRLRGRCTRAPSYDPQGERISFWMADDTGEIYISAYRAQTRQIIQEGRIPALGDLIEVAGTLRVHQDFLALTVEVPEGLTVTRPEPMDRAIGSIVAADQYHRVRVRGQVRRVHAPYPGLTLITVRDKTGAIPVAVSQDLVALSATSPPGRAATGWIEEPISYSETLPTGQAIEVVATVSLHGDTPQLVPASVADIVPLSQPAPAAAERDIGELTLADVEEWAAVRGTIAEVQPFSAGVKLTLVDATGAIFVLLWQSVHDQLPDPATLAVGAELRVQGQVSQYQGELELIPELATDVELLAVATSRPTPPPPTATLEPADGPPPTETDRPADSPSPTPLPTPQETPTPVLELTPIQEITAARADEEVTVEGRIVDTASFSAGFKFTLDDGTGQIALLIWHEVYDDCWDAPEINLGAKVCATGQIGQYEGELQIQPGLGGDVKVIEEATAWAPQREIGALSASDAGQRVTIEGQVVRVEGLPSAAKVFVSDDSGEILVFIWRTTLDRIANNAALGTPGSRVRVSGPVELYRGNLEVVPTLPNDVIVLETG